MKKYLLLIALFAGCNFAFTSCSDDDDNADEIDTEAAFSEEAMAAYCALNELCDIEELPSNWQTYTAEPTYGYAIDASNPYVRTVYVEDVIEAEDCFRSLGGTIESGQSSATFTAGSISYVYTAKNQSDLLATIDCNVPQVPHLTQIRFVPSEMQDDNGLFGFSWAKDKSQDNIYYSFGDVIEYEGTYWVCVRPAIYGVKHKTYWVAICADQMAIERKLFKDSFHTIDATKKKHGTYVVPTKLATDVTCVRNLMILLDALAYPECYGNEAQKYALGVGGESKKISNFINPQFFEIQKKIWKKATKYNMYELLGVNRDRYTDVPNMGYSIFYKGYSSWGVTMTLWTLENSIFTEMINPDKDIKEVELKWKLSDLSWTEQLDLRNYCSNDNYEGGYFATTAGVGITDMQLRGVNLPEYAFFVKDACFADSPYSEIKGSKPICLYKDYSADVIQNPEKYKDEDEGEYKYDDDDLF